MEKLQVRCPSCDRKLLFEEKQVGRRAKCPTCSTAVLLSPDSSSQKSSPEIDDPFAEMAEGHEHRPAKKQTDVPSSPAADAVRPQKKKPKKKATPADDGSQSSGTRIPNAPARRSKLTESQESRRSLKSEKERKIPNAESSSIDESQAEDMDQGSENASEIDTTDSGEVWADDAEFNETYIDEFGLADLVDTSASLATEPTSLPPVQKQYLKKPKRKQPAADESPLSEAPVRTKPLPRQKNAGASEPTSIRRTLIYALFLLTMVPLGIEILFANDADLVQRINETYEEETDPEVWEADPDAVPEPDDEEADGLDGVVRSLPGQRIKGALLTRDSSIHWIFAGISGVTFLCLFVALFRRHQSALGGAIAGAVFTATAGILLLICLQWAAISTQSLWVRGRGLVVLLFYLVKAIGYSYRCALEEGSGFVSSFMGFTLGVGVCEEFCKILPVLVYLGTAKKSTWQGACLVGLASGVGFAVSEGIMYSSSYYNGISGGGIYLVRFVSCVALHAVWTGVGSVLLYFNQDSVQISADWSDMFAMLAMTLGVSIILHGLYDTLLKQEYEIWALVVGLLSVAWFIVVIEKRTRDDGVLA